MWIYELSLTSLPTSFGGLSSLTDLTISHCNELERLPDSLGDLSSLTNFEIRDCSKLECLPDSLGDLSTLTTLKISFCSNLECLPDSLGDFSSFTKLEIRHCSKLECLPDSLGDLSSLANLEIRDCSKLECLPDSLGDLSSLTTLKIDDCPNLETLPKSVRQLNNLQTLTISFCPISELDFGVAPLSSRLSNLKWIYLRVTGVHRISFSEDCCPHLERLDVLRNYHLEKIEELPRSVESIYLRDSEMLKNIPSIASLTSLKKFHVNGCYGIEKIVGIENCTGLTELIVKSYWDVPGMESLEHMQNLKLLVLSANKGSVIDHCIPRIQKWPDEIKIFAQTVPDAASLVDSLLSPNLVILDSISNQKVQSIPNFVQKHSSNSDSFMLCFVINCLSSVSILWQDMHGCDEYELIFKTGRWAWVAVFTQRCNTEIFTGQNMTLKCWKQRDDGKREVDDRGIWADAGKSMQ